MAELSLFEKIIETHQEKKIVSCCKKLLKKSTLTSGAAAQSLCHLAYWLYVYGYIDEALEVCAFSHIEMPQPFHINYNVWDFVLYIWGLEAYLYRQQGNESECAERIEKIKAVRQTPNGCLDTAEKILASDRRIFEAETLASVTYKEKTDRCIAEGNKKDLQVWCFTALFKMIGWGVTGSFPQLEAHREELEAKIDEYVRIVR